MKSVPEPVSIDTHGNYNIVQAGFQLAMLAGLAATADKDGVVIPGTVDPAELAMRVNLALRDVENLGRWEIVWGPCIYQHENSGVADVVSFAVRNADAKCTVVAIAGTNAHSRFDLDVLDEAVGSTVPFPDGIIADGSTLPTGSYRVGNVSEGTALGVKTLLEMRDQSSKNLQTYLSNARIGENIIFTGHSLGGALCTSLAYWLYPVTPHPITGWKILTLPFAAPTVTDQGFGNSFAVYFPELPVANAPTDYGYFNCVICNRYDTVPFGWTNVRNALPANSNILWAKEPVDDSDICIHALTIYGAVGGLGHELTAQAIFNYVNEKYKKLGGRQPYRKLNALKFRVGAQPGPANSFAGFFAIVVQQHVDAYYEYLLDQPKGIEAYGIGIGSLPLPEEIAQRRTG